MRYPSLTAMMVISLFAFFAGCQSPAKKPASSPQAETFSSYTGPTAARQPKRPPTELGLEPSPAAARLPKRSPAELGIEPSAAAAPGAGGASARVLQSKLDLALREKGDAERSAESLRKAVDEAHAAQAEDRKALEEARSRLAQLQAEKSKTEPAARQAPKDEDTFQKLLDLGRELYDRDDFATARRLFQGLADLGYENGTMFFMLGRCCQEMEEPEAALSNYSKACELFQRAEPKPPAYVRTLLNMGVILRSQRRYADAEEVYKRAVKADSNYPNACYNLGLLYEECLKDTPKALAAYEKYIDLHGEKYQEVQDRVKRLRAIVNSQAK